jgi:hypothetical protein
MRIDETIPGFCCCRSAYAPHARQPYPYLSPETDEDTPTATPSRRLRILAPLPIPETFRNGLATERTPRVIKTGSDVRTDTAQRHRDRQARADVGARRRLSFR